MSSLPPRQSGCGLSNLGYTCCMNAPVQVLYAFKDFVKTIAARVASGHHGQNKADKAVACELNATLKNMETHGIGRIAPEGLQGTLNAEFQKNQQHDAHEIFLRLTVSRYVLHCPCTW